MRFDTKTSAYHSTQFVEDNARSKQLVNVADDPSWMIERNQQKEVREDGNATTMANSPPKEGAAVAM